MSKHVIGVVGNPNCGKTTLFNALTGANQRVGNWSGVTVDKKSGEYSYQGKNIELVDLPGIYSLSASSLDEEVARDFLLSGEADLVLVILDAANLERNLYLTVQLAEMQVPFILALNMMDVAKKKQIEIDVSLFQRGVGAPVVPMIASRKKGIDDLKEAINKALSKGTSSKMELDYPEEVKNGIEKLVSIIEKEQISKKIDSKYAAIKLLEQDEKIAELVSNEVLDVSTAIQKRIEAEHDEEADILIAESRYELIRDLTKDSVKRKDQINKTLSDKIDNIVLNRILGVPLFFFAMYLVFMITINIGGAFIDFFDILTGAIFVDGFAELLNAVGSPKWLTTLLASGIGGGVQTIATFIPPIGFMFLSLCFLEDSGYMARAAFVMDRFMRKIGLPGKAFVSMLVGFGCNVPAIMSTRTLENQRDRMLAVSMNPFMSCGARLPVYALFAAAFFPSGGQNLVFSLYLIGIGFAILTGLILKNTLLKGDVTPFVMELPPYHLPTITGVWLRTWERLKSFVFRAGKVIVPMVVVLSFLNSLGTDGTFGNEDSRKSVLSQVGRTITPVFSPMGISQENWPATVGIFTGVFAKEAVVGTLNSIYGGMAEAEGGTEEGGSEEPFSLMSGVEEAFATIPENLKGITDTLLDPLGLSVGNVSSIEVASEEQEVDAATFGAMVKLFDGKVGAMAYLLFILLYFPCVAAIAAVYRETNLRWTIFIGAWTTGLGYMAAVLFYQIGTISRNPTGSVMWIVSIGVVFSAVVAYMRFLGNKGSTPLAVPSTEISRDEV